MGWTGDIARVSDLILKYLLYLLRASYDSICYVELLHCCVKRDVCVICNGVPVTHHVDVVVIWLRPS